MCEMMCSASRAIGKLILLSVRGCLRQCTQITETVIVSTINVHFVQKTFKYTETVARKHWEGTGQHKGRYYGLQMNRTRGGVDSS